MVDRAKREIANYIAQRDGISYYCAEDIVDHIQSVITDTLAGENGYPCCNAVMRDYDLPLDWLWAFLYNEQNDFKELKVVLSICLGNVAEDCAGNCDECVHSKFCTDVNFLYYLDKDIANTQNEC